LDFAESRMQALPASAEHHARNLPAKEASKDKRQTNFKRQSSNTEGFCLRDLEFGACLKFEFCYLRFSPPAKNEGPRAGA
jgi:hypothetical protein